jgi:hypothetical protein
VSNEFKRIWNETVVAFCKVLCLHLPGGPEESHAIWSDLVTVNVVDLQCSVLHTQYACFVFRTYCICLGLRLYIFQSVAVAPSAVSIFKTYMHKFDQSCH